MESVELWSAAKVPDREKAKAVLLEAALVAGEVGIQRTNQYKAFWKAHLIHLRRCGVQLTDWPIVKLDHGPGPGKGKPTLEKMEKDGLLRIKTVQKGPYPSLRSLVPAELRGRATEFCQQFLTAAERESVDAAVKEVGTDDALGASRRSHVESRAWREAEKIGDGLDIYIDLFKTDGDFEAARRRIERDTREIESLFDKP